MLSVIHMYRWPLEVKNMSRGHKYVIDFYIHHISLRKKKETKPAEQITSSNTATYKDNKHLEIEHINWIVLLK